MCETTNPTYTVSQEVNLVVIHTGFRQFFHTTVHIEQTIVRINDIFPIHEQTEVSRFIGSDM